MTDERQNRFPDRACRRKTSRLSLCIPGRLIMRDATFDCAIEDISQEGAQVTCTVPLVPGECGILQSQRLDVFFDVVWSDRDRQGLKFAEPVSEGMIRSVRWFNDWYREQMAQDLRKVLRGGAGGRKS